MVVSRHYHGDDSGVTYISVGCDGYSGSKFDVSSNSGDCDSDCDCDGYFGGGSSSYIDRSSYGDGGSSGDSDSVSVCYGGRGNLIIITVINLKCI